jgi:uncharacterized protein
MSAAEELPEKHGDQQVGMKTRHQPQIAAIYRYPVKGLTPQSLEIVTVTAGETLPLDRAYAIENGPGRFDPTTPRHLPKINFLMLMRDERLASLQTDFDDLTHTLTIRRDGKQVARGKLDTPTGRRLIEQFIAAYMKDTLRGPPHVVAAEGHSFSDVSEKCIHIVNLATVRELSRLMGHELDPLRFRANVYLDDMPAWKEFDWLDREIGLGSVSAHVFARTQRCAATSVDPRSAQRDVDVPSALLRLKGHTDLGIYVILKNDGTIAVGDRVGER